VVRRPPVRKTDRMWEAGSRRRRMDTACRTVRCFIREAAVQRADTAAEANTDDWRSASTSV
jgi:hypothetical protein